MKTIVCVIAAACAAGVQASAQASEFAPVVAKSEIVREVSVPRQVCRSETVETQGERSAAGGVIGGVAGGVLGHTVGRGSGKTAATVVGAITGAIVGDRIDNRDNAPSTKQVQRCDTVMDRQDEVVGYRVTYEYAGKRYTTRMPHDPGDNVELQISVVGSEPDSVPAVYQDEPPRRRHRR